MKLYLKPGACSLASHIVLEEIGAPYDTMRVDLKTKKMADGGDFFGVNPKGYVPALELPEGGVLTENVAVLGYLGDRKPEAKLAPAAGTMERYRIIEWLGFISSEMHKSFSPFFAGWPEEAKAASKQKLEKRLDHVEKALQGKDYLMGADFTVADAYLYTMLTWAPAAGLDVAKWPTVKAYQERVAARPAVKAAHAAEA